MDQYDPTKSNAWSTVKPAPTPTIPNLSKKKMTSEVIDCENVLQLVQDDYTSLFRVKKMGETVELTVPAVYPGSTMVTVFVTTRDKRIIASDAGHLNELLEKCEPDMREKLLLDFQEEFGIKKTVAEGFFYKECSEIKILSSIIFDLCHFLSHAEKRFRFA
jgi:hypothetical protein